MKTTLLLATVSSVLSGEWAHASEAPQSSVFQLTPYLWAASFDGTVGAGGDDDGRVDVDTGFDELELGGFMMRGEWRNGPWSLFGDWSYAKVSSEASPRRGLLYSGAEAEVRGHIVQGSAGYAVYREDDLRVDLVGGLRYLNVKVGLDLDGGLLSATSLQEDDSWVDAVAGLRGSVPLSQRWHLGWYGDAGSGGSELTWQLAGWLDYRFSWGSVGGGWRHLYVDYEKSRIKLDAALTGPFIAADFHF